MANKGSGGAPAILVGGLTAGILDIADAFVFFGLRGAKPLRILQSIASGLLGPKAYSGGWSTAILGGALHFSIAITAAAVYYFASRKLTFLKRSPVLSGLLYGVAVYLFMNAVVLPLSNFRTTTPSGSVLVNGLLAHMFLVGLPISLAVRRWG
ncbi:MAG: hypothetical protein H7Y20_01060 [Bryobacteraceae bacterium]|nr:hypothetical protein [Bryobacteraceae bacterium]